jgi:hypothetical protein
MINIDPSQAKPLSDFLPADKARLCVELVSALRDAGMGEPVEIRDDFGVLGYFVPVGVYAGMPPEGTPEFEAEVGRRMASKEPVVPAEEFIAWLEAQMPVNSDDVLRHSGPSSVPGRANS